MQVDGKVAMVVGGASGMARSAAEMLAAKGATIAICDLGKSDGAAVAEGIGSGATFHEIDVMDFDGTGGVIDAVAEAHGGIHIAINTAGGAVGQRTLGKEGPHSLDDFRRIVDLNLIGTFNVARLVAEKMASNEPDDAAGERGVIINTASIAAFEGQIGQVAYTAAKAGVAGMTLTMARDLGSLGIRVMTVAPSLFATGLTEGIPDEWAEALTKDAAFPKRMGLPHEYGSLAVAIVETPMLNGSTIRLDAGQRFAPK